MYFSTDTLVAISLLFPLAQAQAVAGNGYYSITEILNQKIAGFKIDFNTSALFIKNATDGSMTPYTAFMMQSPVAFTQFNYAGSNDVPAGPNPCQGGQGQNGGGGQGGQGGGLQKRIPQVLVGSQTTSASAPPRTTATSSTFASGLPPTTSRPSITTPGFSAGPNPTGGSNSNGGNGGGNEGENNGSRIANLPFISVNYQGLFSLNCTGLGPIKSTLEDFAFNNPHAGYVLAPATADPAATLLNIYFGGFNLNETLFPNRVFLAKMIPPGAQNLFTALSYSCGTCTLNKNITSPLSLVTADGVEVSYPIVLTKKDPQCTSAGAKAAVKFINDVSSYASSIQDPSQVAQLTNSFQVLAAKETMQGCKQLLGSYLTFANSTVNVTNSIDCPYRRNDDRWKASPCCNPNVKNQCCAPSPVTQNVLIVQSLNSTLLNGVCQNPDKIASLANLAASSYNYALEVDDNNPRTLFESYSAFIGQCNQAVFNTACSSDSDCLYSNTCLTQAGLCYVDFANPAPMLMKCYIANAKSDLITELQSILQVPSLSDTAAAAGALANALNVPAYSSQTCVGRTGFKYNGQPSLKTDSNGNIVSDFTAPDGVACVQEHQCSYSPWTRLSNSSCTGDKLPGFCATCLGSSSNICAPVSGSQTQTCSLQFPRNDRSYNTYEDDCASYGGRLIQDVTNDSNFKAPPPTCALDNRSANVTYCSQAPISISSYGGRNNPNNVTCDATRTDSNRCSDFICYSTSEQQTSCRNSGNLVKQWFNSDAGGVCRYPTLSFNECKSVQNYGTSAFAAFGTSFQAGVFHTQASCPNQVCSRNTDFGSIDVSNATQCSALNYCTQPCPRCRSIPFKDTGCFNLTVTNSGDCNSMTGSPAWQQPPANSPSAPGLCFIGAHTNRATCTAANLTYFDLSSVTTTSQCSSYPASFQAEWRPFDTCASETTCANAGQCDDFEFGQNGACVYMPTSGIPGDCGGGKPTRSGQCIDSSITSSSSCQSPKNWVIRATSAAACTAYGARCFTKDGKQTFVSPEQCAACGGTSVPLYHWSAPQWLQAQMVPAQWIPTVQWSPINTFQSSLDLGTLQNLVQKAIGGIIVRKMVGDFNKQYTALAAVFQAFACDCLDMNPTCFSQVVASSVGGCTADPTTVSNCNGAVIDNGVFNTSVPVSIDVTLDASASFLGAPPDSNNLRKRGVKTTSANYNVVVNQAGTDVGLIIGNAMNYTFSQTPVGNVTICLPIDSSIPADASVYPNYDIVQAYSNGTISPAFFTNVTISGTNVCANVSSFKSASFMPVQRNSLSSKDVIVVTTTTASATTTTAAGSGSTSATPVAPGASATATVNSARSTVGSIWTILLSLFIF